MYAFNKVIAERRDGEEFFYLTDHLGSTVMMTDDQGNIVWQNDVTPFGEETGESGFVERDGFYTGKKIDRDTGLYYFNARWYDPQLGRFITEDPVKDGVNWFSYVANNPLRYTDPTGLMLDEDDKKADDKAKRDSEREAKRIADAEARQKAEEARQKAELRNQKTYSYEELTQGAIFNEAGVSMNVAKLENAQNAAMTHPKYQGGSGGVFDNPPNPSNTWCNTSTQAIAKATGFNTDYLQADGKILSDSTANEAYDILQKNAAENNNLFLIDSESATKFADVGYTIIGSSQGANGDRGHLSTIAPGYGSGGKSGPMMANISQPEFTNTRRANRAFGPQHSSVKYYVDLAQFGNDSNLSHIGTRLY